MDVMKVKKKSFYRSFLDDFEIQQFDVSEKIKENLESRKWTVYSLYTLDVALCFVIVGTKFHSNPQFKILQFFMIFLSVYF